MKPYIALLLILTAAALVGCKAPPNRYNLQTYVQPIAPDGQPGLTAGFTLPIGPASATTSTATTTTDVEAGELWRRLKVFIDIYVNPAVGQEDRDNAAAAIVGIKKELTDRGLWRQVPLVQHEGDDPLVREIQEILDSGMLTNQQIATPGPAPEPGFWKGLLWDYRDGTETLKTTFWQLVAAYGLAGVAHEIGWVDIGGFAFWDSSDDEAERSRNLNQAATALANADANTAEIDGSGNEIELKDLPQDTEIKLTVRGNNNTASLDFQRDTQRETTVTFTPTPSTVEADSE